MDYQDKTKDELIKELQKLQQENDLIKKLYEEVIPGRKQTEELQAMILRSIPLLIYYSDTTDKYSATWISENVKQVTGFDQDVFLKEMYFWSSRLHPDDRERVIRVFNELQESEKGAIEYRWQCANGNYHWFLDSFSSFKKNQEDKIEFVGVWLDITERKLADEQIKESEKRFHSLFENMLNGFAYCKMIFNGDSAEDFIYLEVNKAFEALTGLKDVMGKSVLEIIPGIRESDKELFDAYARVSLTGIPEFFETYVNTLKKWFSVSVYSPRKEYFVAVFDVISERKRAEEALYLEKENFRNSLDDSPLGVRIATIEGDTIYANKVLLSYYGYESLEELQATSLKDRYTPESFIMSRKRKKQRGQGDFSVTDYEISIIRKDGEIRHLQVFRKEVLWNGVKQFQVIYKDITNHKLAEEEVIKSKNLLEDLHKHLNDMRENERASISREIHDQLGQSMTALKLDLNRMHKYIKTNPEAVTKLEGMIDLVSDTIKDVQRISSDLRPGILDELGLVSAIEWYCDEFKNRTGIKCILKLDDSDFNDSKITLVFFRVLQETLTNVIRHAKASSVNIKLLRKIKGTTMTIQDNGIGISEEQIRSTKSLGLISMRERVKQFNGTIDISSKKGNGTELIIFIPS